MQNRNSLKKIIAKITKQRPIFGDAYIFYFHVNGSIGIVRKIDFEIRPDLGCTTPKTSRKVVLDNPSVCVSVCLAVCLAVASPASCHRRKVQPIELKL